jgi:hypothetical protein
MSSLVTVSRVTIIADSAVEKQLLDQFIKLGAKGYTCVDCRGRGVHEVFEDLWPGSQRVRIETIVQPPVAEKILAFVHSPQFKSRAMRACLETVQVAAGDIY